MKKYIKKLAIYIIFLGILLTLNTSIYAASISGNTNVNVGDTVTITFNFGENVAAYDNIGVSYDTTVLEYVSGDSLSESVWWDDSSTSMGIATKTYTFKALKAATTKITVVCNGAISADTNMTELGNLLVTTTINITQETTETEDTTSSSEASASTTTTTTTTTSSNPSSNNYLKYLQLSEEGITPYFTRSVTSYSLSVSSNVTSIDVLARAEDSSATVEISGNENLTDGDNIIQIKVTAEDGSVKLYKIIVTKSSDANSANAYLSSLIIEGYNLDKEFQSEEFKYDIGEISSTVEALNIVAIAQADGATIEIEGADSLVEDGNITIKVTSEDGTITREYIISYTLVSLTSDEIISEEMEDALVEIQSSNTTKDKVISYLKYIWLAIKKNYLLVIMYVLLLIELIYIIYLRKTRKSDNDDGDDNGGDDNNSLGEKELLKIEKKEEVQAPTITPIEDNTQNLLLSNEVNNVPSLSDEVKKVGRRGNVSRADGIKLVDLDKNEGPQDELTFNIFENLKDDDIKELLKKELDDNND